VTYDPSEREAQLKQLVWDKIPKHLSVRPLSPTYEQLVSDFNWKHSWLLLGRTGNGKSTACVHLVRRLVNEGVAAGGDKFKLAKSIFWTRADFITRSGSRDDLQAHQILHRAEHAKLLILDDLAEASKTLLGVLQARYDNPDPHPLVVTSGALNVRELEEKCKGEAVVRWILEAGGVEPGVVLGEE
jgi:DNA replication protein DnaC